MNLSRVESLLEQLVHSQDVMNYRLEKLEFVLNEKLTAATFALDQIQSATTDAAVTLTDVKHWELAQALTHLQAIEDELSWHKDLSLGKRLLDALDGIETQLTINGS